MKMNVEKQSVKEWLNALDSAAKGKRYAKLWKKTYGLVAVPSRKRTTMNLYKIDRYSKAGENVIVPGKVLSTGMITHKFNISAIEFSAGALKALKAADCKVVDIKEMINAEKVHVLI